MGCSLLPPRPSLAPCPELNVPSLVPDGLQRRRLDGAEVQLRVQLVVHLPHHGPACVLGVY